MCLREYFSWGMLPFLFYLRKVFSLRSYSESVFSLDLLRVFWSIYNFRQWMLLLNCFLYVCPLFPFLPTFPPATPPYMFVLCFPLLCLLWWNIHLHRNFFNVFTRSFYIQNYEHASCCALSCFQFLKLGHGDLYSFWLCLYLFVAVVSITILLFSFLSKGTCVCSCAVVLVQ